jgi:hypothetical protein
MLRSSCTIFLPVTSTHGPWGKGGERWASAAGVPRGPNANVTPCPSPPGRVGYAAAFDPRDVEGRTRPWARRAARFRRRARLSRPSALDARMGGETQSGRWARRAARFRRRARLSRPSALDARMGGETQSGRTAARSAPIRRARSNRRCALRSATALHTAASFTNQSRGRATALPRTLAHILGLGSTNSQSGQTMAAPTSGTRPERPREASSWAAPLMPVDAQLRARREGRLSPPSPRWGGSGRRDGRRARWNEPRFGDASGRAAGRRRCCAAVQLGGDSTV